MGFRGTSLFLNEAATMEGQRKREEDEHSVRRHGYSQTATYTSRPASTITSCTRRSPRSNSHASHEGRWGSEGLLCS